MSRPVHRATFVIALAAGCGSGAAPHDGGPAGAAGAGGSGGTTGVGGSGGSGGLSGCPASAPAMLASCTSGATCFYEDCAGSGRTVARCADGLWSVQTGPCTGGVLCQAQTCQIGQICVELSGGALVTECVSNTCGTGAIGCGCLQSCSGTCTVNGSVASGVTIMCNTCPTNTCA